MVMYVYHPQTKRMIHAITLGPFSGTFYVVIAQKLYSKYNNQPKTCGHDRGEKGEEIWQGGAWGKRDSIVLVAKESGGM